MDPRKALVRAGCDAMKLTFYDAWPIDMSLDHLRAGGFTIVDYDCHPGPNKGHLLILARAT
jgi:hypothetical protein